MNNFLGPSIKVISSWGKIRFLTFVPVVNGEIKALNASGYGQISTEILDAPEFYYAEAYHQQYLAKNPGGYCGLGGTKVCFPETTTA